MTTAQLTALGLVASPSGQITGIDLPISNTNLLAPGYTRRVRLRSLIFDSDLEMTVTYEQYWQNAAGKDAYRELERDMSLSETARRARLSVLQPLQTTKTTRGSWRSGVTGLVVADSSVAGAIPELLYFQNLTRAMLVAGGMTLAGTEPYMLVVYMLVANIAKEIDARGEF